jgi:hypothetical protein
MALTIDAVAESPISLEEYVDTVLREVDPEDWDSIVASAPHFAKLLRNRTLLTDALNAELRQWRGRKTANYYTGQSFSLIETEWCTVRVNIWRPYSAAGDSDDFDRDLSTYEVPHDHNFLFMTGGYFGPGYETEIYEYDNGGFVGIPGEPVDIEFLERTKLEPGKIMMYRPHRDIHSQIAPSDYSVSLNLVVRRVRDLTKQQSTFDVKSKRVVCATDRPVEPQYLICAIARHAADDRTASLLSDLSAVHPDPMVRKICLDSLALVHEDDAEQIFKKGLGDRDPSVTEFARQALEGLGRGMTGSFIEGRLMSQTGYRGLLR